MPIAPQFSFCLVVDDARDEWIAIGQNAALINGEYGYEEGDGEAPREEHSESGISTERLKGGQHL